MGHTASTMQSAETTTHTSASLSGAFNAGKVPVSLVFTARLSDASWKAGVEETN